MTAEKELARSLATSKTIDCSVFIGETNDKEKLWYKEIHSGVKTNGILSKTIQEKKASKYDNLRVR